MTAEHCHDLFCTCESCRQSRSSDSHDPMATSCAALEGPGPYLPAAVATMLG